MRIGIAQRIQHWDWLLEIAQPSILDAPDNAVAPILAQGQLGLGGAYYASNGNNSYPAAAFLKQDTCATTSTELTRACAWGALNSSMDWRRTRKIQLSHGYRRTASHNG